MSQIEDPIQPVSGPSEQPLASPRPAESRIPSRALRIAGLIFPVLVLLAVAAFLVGRHWTSTALRNSLPQLDGTIQLSGLAAPVTVIRDQHGVPHLHAASVDDLIFAQGYITAQDRLWQMDTLRRHAAGALAEVLGSSMLAHDRAQRLLSLAAAADAALAVLPAGQRHYLDVYAAGVNTSIDEQLPHLPLEFRLLRYQPAPWTPRDSILVGLAMMQDLTTAFPGKLSREAITARLRPELLADLYPTSSWRDHPIQSPIDLTQPHEFEEIPLDSSQSKLTRPSKLIQPNLRDHDLLTPRHILGLHVARATLAQLTSRELCDACTAGSNNWAVSGARTATGKPLLSNDMHLAFNVPGIWYEADLAAPGFHAAGITLPGIPFIVVGHNDHVAWGFTNMGADVQDLAIEHTRGSGPNFQYLADDGSWQPVLYHRELIRVHGGNPIAFDVAATRHGAALAPIISPIFPGEKRMLSLRWTVYDPAALSFPLFAINSAATGDALAHAFADWGGPPENLIYADDAGHIGYHAIGRIPIRGPIIQIPADAIHSTTSIGMPLSPVPVDATAPEDQWSGLYIPYDDLPHLADPADGVLATANNRIAPDGYPFAISPDWGAPYRAERIWKQLATRTGLTAADMLALQNDVYSDLDLTFAHRLAYAIDHASNVGHTLNPKRTRQAADLLRNWNGNVSADAPAPAIVDAARAALWQLILQPQLGDLWADYSWGNKDYAAEQLLLLQPARWLPAQYKNWDDLLTAAVDHGLIATGAPFDLSHWRYGSAHPIDMEHPLFAASPILRLLVVARTGTGPQPAGGDDTTVKQTRRAFGPSERFTADLGNLDASTLNLPLGQSGNPASPYFMDHWPAYTSGTTFALPYTDAAIRASAAHTLTLAPR